MHTNRKLEKVSLAMQTSNELIIKIFIYIILSYQLVTKICSYKCDVTMSLTYQDGWHIFQS